jgi:tyrosine-protein kinase Etk/Wzc
MNTTQAAAVTLPPAQMVEEESSFNPFELLDIVIEQKWLIAGITAAGLAAGYIQSKLAVPIYEASTLMQIEQQGGGLGPMFGGGGSNSTATEIEIMRSRSIVGEAVNNLRLDISVTPKYLPIVGNWLSRVSSQPSNPGFLGMDGYVHGNEKLEIEQLDLPPVFIGQSLLVRLTPKGYLLALENGTRIAEGEIGKPLNFDYLGEKGTVQIKSVIGRPGAEFYIKRESHLAITQAIQANLRVAEIRGGTGVISAVMEDPDPQKAAKVVNEIAAIFVSNSTKRKAAEAEKSVEFLGELLPQLRKEVEASEDKLNQYRIERGIFELSDDAKDLMQQTANQRILLVGLQQKRKQMEKLYTDEHPAMQALDGQIRELSGKIGQIESAAKNLPAVQQELLTLEREVKISDGIYTRLLETYHQLRLTKEGKLGNVRVVDPALTPQHSSKPNRTAMIGMGAAIGLALGLGLAFLRNYLRPGIRDADELEQKLGLNVFATVPYSPVQDALAKAIKDKVPGQHLLALAKPDDAAVESLRSLRTALQFAMLDAPNNIVMLTGPTPGIGKSFASANFASVLAAAGKRVLLVDADMRKGHMHKFFGFERGMGLSELIAGSQPLEKVLRQNVTPGLDFIGSGTLPPNPAELLMSHVTVDLLKALSAQYDIVIIDTPPVLAVSDSAVLAPQSGTVFLLARADVTTLAEVQESIKRLEQSGAALRGVIFNGLDLSKRAYRYGYGYKYGYNPPSPSSASATSACRWPSNSASTAPSSASTSTRHALPNCRPARTTRSNAARPSWPKRPSCATAATRQTSRLHRSSSSRCPRRSTRPTGPT